jgi:hypothetical protein
MIIAFNNTERRSSDMPDVLICYTPTAFQTQIVKRLYKELMLYKFPKNMDRINAHNDKQIYLCSEAEMQNRSLNEDTKDRLAKSRCIVVICTQDTKNNPLLNEIIDYYRSLGHWQNIIPILAHGIPVNSFPPGLFSKRTITLIDDNGRPKEYSETIEPLAADIRSQSKRKCLEQIPHATHKIMAAIIGCNYDDLVQRFLRRSQKRQLILTVFFSSILISILLIIGSLWFLSKMEKDKAVLQTEKTISLLKDVYENLPKLFINNPDALDSVNNILLNSVDNLLVRKPRSLSQIDLSDVLELKSYDTLMTVARKASLLRQLHKTQKAIAMYDVLNESLREKYPDAVKRYAEMVKQFLAADSLGFGIYILHTGADINAKIGLGPGDVIIGINGKSFTGPSDRMEVFSKATGTDLKLSIVRLDSDGILEPVHITVKEIPDIEWLGI